MNEQIRRALAALTADEARCVWDALAQMVENDEPGDDDGAPLAHDAVARSALAKLDAAVASVAET